MDEKLAASDDGGGLLSYVMALLVRGRVVRGKHVLPRVEAWVETIRRLCVAEASTWA